MKLTVLAIKRPDGLWHFDHEHENTKEELLCNGTEKVIDYFFELRAHRPPSVGDTLEIELDTEPTETYDTILRFVSTDEYGTVYIDGLSSMSVWLCPWLQSYFKHKPETIYITTRWTYKIVEVSSSVHDDIMEIISWGAISC